MDVSGEFGKGRNGHAAAPFWGPLPLTPTPTSTICSWLLLCPVSLSSLHFFILFPLGTTLQRMLYAVGNYVVKMRSKLHKFPLDRFLLNLRILVGELVGHLSPIFLRITKQRSCEFYYYCLLLLLCSYYKKEVLRSSEYVVNPPVPSCPSIGQERSLSPNTSRNSSHKTKASKG